MHYKDLVRSDTFIGRYLAHMQHQETAEAYDWWCALWLLSIACGRLVYVSRPRAPVYLNLYAILVAESGITRKSSAVRMAQSLAHELSAGNVMGILEGKITPERMDALLHERTQQHGSAQLCIAISELAVFLGVERYTATMPALLTDLYDCPAVRHGGGSISSGAIHQENVFVAFLSASTPSWLLRSVNPTVVEGGFTSRCMFVVSDEPKRRIAWPDDADELAQTDQSQLLADLQHVRMLAKVHETITINEAALKVFRLWYSRRKPSMGTFCASFESREDAHILRLAAFLCINDNSWIIQAGHVRIAIRIIADIKQSSAALFAGTREHAKFVLGIETARRILLSHSTDPMPRSKLWLHCRKHLDRTEFTAMLDVLHEIGAIQRFIMKHDGAGRPTDLVAATKLLAGRGLVEQLTERLGH